MRLGKIECGAKALACGLACTSFNFAKRWHCVFHFSTVVYFPDAVIAIGVRSVHRIEEVGGDFLGNLTGHV